MAKTNRKCLYYFCLFTILGLVSEVMMRKKEMEVLANLKNIVILDCDKDAFYKKVQSALSLLSPSFYHASFFCNL